MRSGDVKAIRFRDLRGLILKSHVIRPICAHFAAAPSLRASLRILERRFESRS
jgi:hypothetical protein